MFCIIIIIIIIISGDRVYKVVSHSFTKENLNQGEFKRFTLLYFVWRSAVKHHLSVVACGDRLNETVVMLKSAVLFSQEPFHAHIFVDDDLRPQFQQQVW